MIIQRLPPELIERIGELLPRRDLHQCILINRMWHAAMIPMLYRTVLVTSTANAFDSMVRLNGLHVRQLVVEDDILSPEDTRTLCSRCPNLTELEYVWPKKDTAHTTASAASNSGFPRSPPLLLQQIVDPKKLVGLRLKYLEAKQQDENASIIIVYEFFFSLLRILPSCLRSLSLVGMLPILRVTDLEAIHMAFPSLTQLTVEGSHMVLTPIGQIDTCHPTLRSLRIAYPSGWSQVSRWIHLIFTHYPNLEELELVNTSRGCRVLRPFAADARLTDTLAYPQRLAKLKLLRLGVYSYEWMTPFTHLHALVDVEIQSDRDWDMVLWLGAVCDRLKRLSINFPRENNEQVLHALAKFRQLTDLTLTITSALWFYTFFRAGCPPSLRRLTMSQGYVGYGVDTSKVVLSAVLTHLSLHRVTFVDPSTLDHVVAGCPALESIKTLACVWISSPSDDQQHIRVDFGQHQLSLLSMSYSSIMSFLATEPDEIRCYKFDLSSPTAAASSAPVEDTVERTGCKRIRDLRGQQETSFLVTFEASTPPQVSNHSQKIRRKTGLHTYTTVGTPEESPSCMIIKCKSIKKLCINGHLL